MSLINMEANHAKNGQKSNHEPYKHGGKPCQKGIHAKNGLKGDHEPYKHGGKPCQKWSKG